MIPFFVYLLIELGLLLSPEQWNTLPQAEQERLENIIIVDGTIH